MEIRNRLAYLTEEEQRITDLPSPIAADAISMDMLRFRSDRMLDYLEDLRMSEDDELTHAERAALPGKIERAKQEKIVLDNMAEQLTVHALWRARNKT
jgi:hypothetical protein